MNDRLIRCIGCGARVPRVSVAENPFGSEASPGCRRLYARIVPGCDGPREDSESLLLVSAAWALQHPGSKHAESIRAVNTHLITLCAALDYRIRSEAVAVLTAQAVRRFRPDFTWLEPPRWPGPLTVADVAAECDTADRSELIRNWALGVYRAWEPYHDIIKGYLKGVLAYD